MVMTSFVAALQRTIKAEVVSGHPLQNGCQAAKRLGMDEATTTLTNTGGTAEAKHDCGGIQGTLVAADVQTYLADGSVCQAIRSPLIRHICWAKKFL